MTDKKKIIRCKVINYWGTGTPGYYELELECGHIVGSGYVSPLRGAPKTSMCAYCMGTDLASNPLKGKENAR